MKYFKPLVTLVASLFIISAPLAASAQMSRKEQARNHFTKGNALHQGGKYLQAIKEMKAAYKIIPKPIILFYIGEVYKDAELIDEAISYYKRYLDEARVNDKSGLRKKATDTIKKLGGKLVGNAPVVPDPVTKPTVTTPVVKTPEIKKPKVRKQYKKGELIHTPLEEARPNRPAKLEVELPEDIKRAWIYAYFRKPGDDNYTKAKMKVDKNDVYYFIIPCDGMKGAILQYYIEAVGVSGRKIAGSATSSSPFIVDINKSNPLQPGGNMSCDGVSGEKDGTIISGNNGNNKGPAPKGKKKSFYLMVGTGIAAGALVIMSVALGQMAAMEGLALEDSQMSRYAPNASTYPPTRRYSNGIVSFSGTVADHEKRGQSYETTMFITSGLSVIAVAAAAYFTLDYLEIIPKNLSLDAKLGYRNSDDDKSTISITPMIGNDFYGIGGSIRF
jgi:tetratricopeptide (TPR) repeat protein